MRSGGYTQENVEGDYGNMRVAKEPVSYNSNRESDGASELGPYVSKDFQSG